MRGGKGFTLIEVMVVISVISLLASIIYANLSTTREKGRLGAAKYFAAQVDHITDQAVGMWDFDENAGTSVFDKSGFNNTGTFGGAVVPVWSTDVPNGSVSALSFNGSSSYILVNNNSGFDTPYITVAAWVKTSSVGWRKIIGKGPDATEVYGLYVNPSGFFAVEREINNAQVSVPTVARINDNVWHYVAYVYDGATEQFYVDGALVKSVATVGTLTSSGENISIGAEKSSISASMFWNGLIDGVRIYNKALLANDVYRSYANDLPRHLIAQR